MYLLAVFGVACLGKRKRDHEESLLDALHEMEDATRVVIQEGNQQREHYMQLLLEAQAQEMDMRRQELELLQAEAAESRRLQQDFQVGFLAVLGQLVSSLSRNKPADSPLD